jgi:hypothetical protein
MMNTVHVQLQLARTKSDPGAHLLNGTVECQFDGTGIPDPA